MKKGLSHVITFVNPVLLANAFSPGGIIALGDVGVTGLAAGDGLLPTAAGLAVGVGAGLVGAGSGAFLVAPPLVGEGRITGVEVGAGLATGLLVGEATGVGVGGTGVAVGRGGATIVTLIFGKLVATRSSGVWTISGTS